MSTRALSGVSEEEWGDTEEMMISKSSSLNQGKNLVQLNNWEFGTYNTSMYVPSMTLVHI